MEKLLPERVRRFLYGLAGPNGDRAAILAANTVRSVAIGIVVTAGVQALIAGMGLVVASIPAPGLLTAVCLILCLAQIGPMLVMLPAIVWKFYTGDIVWACVLTAFLVAATMDFTAG
jgi:predicted PurR-regulated permease PerM